MSAEKTLIMFEFIPEEVFFFELPGDLSRFHDVYVNKVIPKGSGPEVKKLQNELNDFMFDDSGIFRFEEKKIQVPTKDWTHFVRCGFLL